MSRPKDKKINVAPRPSAPLQNPFGALDAFDALKDLPKPPEPEKPAPVQQAPRRSDMAAKPAKPAVPAGSRGRLILRREKKDRGGKTVVVVYGFAELPGANAVMIADLAKELKGKLGVGGSFDRQEIILQGDKAAAVCAVLEQLGFRVDGVRE